MTQELSLVATLNASAAIKLHTVSADVEIIEGEGADIEISATTPGFWTVGEDGSICETGGVVAEALSLPPKAVVFGGSVNVSGGVSRIDGRIFVNGTEIQLPDPLEKLVIALPRQYGGDLSIDSQYFGKIKVLPKFKARVKATVSMDVSLELSDQSEATGINLSVTLGGKIRTGNLGTAGDILLKGSHSGSQIEVGSVTAEGVELQALVGASIVGGIVKAGAAVQLLAENSGSSVRVGRITAGSLQKKASLGGKVVTGGIQCREEVTLIASMSGSSLEPGHIMARRISGAISVGGRIEGKNLSAREGIGLVSSQSSKGRFVSVWAPKVELEAAMSGTVDLTEVIAQRLECSASKSGAVDVLKGSADCGKAHASMGGKVSLKGQFAALKSSESMGGEVTITEDKPDADERIFEAVRRGFNYELWDDSLALMMALLIGGTFGQSVKQSGSGDKGDDIVVTVLGAAMPFVLRNSDVVKSIRDCAGAFGKAFGGTEKLAELEDIEALAKAIQSPEVTALLVPAVALFSEKVFAQAQSLNN